MQTWITDALLAIIAVTLIVASVRAEMRHQQLLDLLNEQATMIGDIFPFLRELEKLAKNSGQDQS